MWERSYRRRRSKGEIWRGTPNLSGMSTTKKQVENAVRKRRAIKMWLEEKRYRDFNKDDIGYYYDCWNRDGNYDDVTTTEKV